MIVRETETQEEEEEERKLDCMMQMLIILRSVFSSQVQVQRLF